MTGYDGRGGRYDITAPQSTDLAIVITAPVTVDLSAATCTATVYNALDVALESFSGTISGSGSNISTITITDTQLDALTAPASWAYTVRRGGDDKVWVAGAFTVVPPDQARPGSSTNEITVATPDAVTVTIEVGSIGGSGGSTDAADITIVDTAGYYTATNVEAALAEVKLVADTAAGGGITLEQVQDDLGNTSLVAGTSLTKVYDDAAGTITLNVDAADFATAASISDHIADTADAHDASAISVLDTGTLYTATNVEAALAEVKTIADAAVTPGEAAAAYQPLATVLTNTTASFTTADETKLDGIEAAADVTDTTNVTAAGALMDSEVDADIKTLALPANTTISAYGATLVDDADAATARTTLGLGTGATATIAHYLPKVAAGASVENVGAIESNVQTVAATGATETLDTSVYGVFDMTMDQACTFTFSNPAPSGKATIFTLILRGAFTPTLPASIDWGDATAPTYTTPSMYVFTTVDGGTIWLGAQVAKAFG